MKILTPNQCAQIAGGDPGGVLAGGGSGSGVGAGVGGGGWSNGDMALAGMGIGFAGGPPAIVSINRPDDVALSGFDKFLLSSVSGAYAGATGAFILGVVEGAEIGAVFGPAGAALGALVMGGIAYATAQAALQHAANDGAYTDGHGVRHAAR
jgi:hypothetical protein